MPVNAPIVVAVDGSEQASNAVRWGSRAAVRENRPLHIVSVTAPPAPAFTLAAVSAVEASASAGRSFAEAAVELAKGLAEDTAEGVAVSGEVIEGRPGLALRDISSRAHILVVGRRGLGGVSGLLLGSVSTHVASHAECPVVVVSDQLPSSGPVVVGVDGSPTSTDAIAQAFAQAGFLDTSLVAVHAYGGYSGAAFFEASEEVKREMDDEARETLGTQLAGYGQDFPDVDVETVVTSDAPSNRITELSKDAQLVVVGSRGYGGFRGLMLGSTSQAVLHVAQCPVMVVQAA
uniref:universal stress protein n=1 Tax=Gordonia sp. B7-2 TaxID=3420932 RepID=UPI003D92AB36